MIPIRPVNILLPSKADYEKWAVVACDQFTSQKDYWQSLDELVGNAPSTLRLIYPEVYLGEADYEKRIEDIQKTMRKYLEDGVFEEHKNCCVLVKRSTVFGNQRLGIVLGVDLEEYCFTHPSHASVRSTEDVVASRIPPRVKIRRGAPLELPHVILLLDDEKKSVIETLVSEDREVLYDFDLNMQGGHITGYKVSADEITERMSEYVSRKLSEGKDFLVAVGDGNHSLATAQAYWNEIRETLTEEERKTHPARIALCEVENLYDEGIIFEPIHRFVFGADENLISMLESKLAGNLSVRTLISGVEKNISVPDNSAQAISAVQSVLEEYVAEHKECSIDYIHGEDNLKEIAAANGGVALFMPSMKKDELFSYVSEHGTLCKKTFSMGEAQEKRYYIEAKRI
ncbi:MAG: DUF1015 domain-containing protein [Clostridia bacterium]|nr:DUF1015 domain-containing protein [Clostridia bacterium]